MPLFPISENDANGTTKLYTKVGVLPFILNENSRVFTYNLDKLVDEKINLLLENISKKITDDNAHNEIAGIFPAKLIDNISIWKRNSQVQKERCNKIIRAEFQRDKEKVIKQDLEPNGNLKIFLKNFESLTQNQKINLDKWTNLFCVEPIRWEQYSDPNCRYKKSNFSFFYGNTEPTDTSVLEGAIREAREEGSMNIHPDLFSDGYQQQIRTEHNLQIPLVLEYPFTKDGITYWSRVYLLFLDNVKVKSNNLQGFQKAFEFSIV